MGWLILAWCYILCNPYFHISCIQTYVIAYTMSEMGTIQWVDVAGTLPAQPEVWFDIICKLHFHISCMCTYLHICMLHDGDLSVGWLISGWHPPKTTWCLRRPTERGSDLSTDHWDESRNRYWQIFTEKLFRCRESLHGDQFRMVDTFISDTSEHSFSAQKYGNT